MWVEGATVSVETRGEPLPPARAGTDRLSDLPHPRVFIDLAGQPLPCPGPLGWGGNFP